MGNNIAAIVVTYNRCELLVECIDALLKSTIETDILVINNASTDQTEEILQPLIKENKIIYFNTQKNLGGAGGYHFGISKAYERGYDYFWLMDDDTIVKADALEVLVEASKSLDDQFGFLSGMALWVDGTECKMNHHTVADDWNDSKKMLNEGMVAIRTATFVNFFVSREVVEKVGLPIKEYFIWGDDTEYSQRIAVKYHLPSYLVAGSEVIHKMEKNQWTNRMADITERGRVERMFFSIRNDTCTYKRLDFLLFAKFSLFMVKNFLQVLFTKNEYKCKKLWIITKAYCAGVFFTPKIEYLK